MEEKKLELEITGIEDIPEKLKSLDEAWQVIISVTNKHGVGVGGKMCAEKRVGPDDKQLFAVLPGQVNAADFRSDKPIIRIYADGGGLLCSHVQTHIFGFNLTNPENGKIYYGVVQ